MLQHKGGQQEPALGGEFALGQLSALGNYVSIVNAFAADTAAGPSNYIIAAIVIKPKATGIFRVNVDLSWSDPNDVEVQWSLLAAEASVTADPITLTGGTPAAIFGSQADATSLGEITVAPFTPIALVNAAAPVTLAERTFIATGTTQGFDINGIFSNAGAGTTKVPFTGGVDCVFYLQVSADAGAIGGLKLQFTVQEEPVA
jgi:hypothetical protein